MNLGSTMPDPHQLLELRGLIAGLCDGELTQAQVTRLEEMVCNDGPCARYYVNAMRVYVMLPQHVGVEHGASGTQLISEWQARDNEFWNDVVMTTTTSDVGGRSSGSTNSEARLSENARREWMPAHKKSPAILTALTAKAWQVITSPSQHAWLAMLWLTGTVFAAVVAILLWSVAIKGPQGLNTPLFVAQLTRSRDAVWSEGTAAPAHQSPLAAGQRLSLASGCIEVSFDSGAVTVVEGPAIFEVQSSKQGFLGQGRAVARVPQSAKGFAIETDSVRVVDLGTEFGIEVDASQNTEIHVLTGVVEAYVPRRATAAPIRVESNRGLRYDSVTHRFGQIPVNRARFKQVLADLSDPIASAVVASTGKPYHLVHGGLQENAPAYTDRTQQWTSVPRELLGASYVRTANGDKDNVDFSLNVSVAGPATLYVFFDDRALPAPEWLVRDFVETGWHVVLNTTTDGAENNPARDRAGDLKFSVWKRSVSVGVATLGPTGRKGVGHYGVALVPESSELQP